MKQKLKLESLGKNWREELLDFANTDNKEFEKKVKSEADQ